QPGARSRDWLKFKCSGEQELVIGGFTAPRGSRSDFGALLVGYNEDGVLRYAGNVGTGFDRETLARLGARVRDLQRDRSPFADVGVTKADLARYYERVEERMLPHLRGRPISMQRFPNGIEGEGFFHKDVPDYFPDWIERVKVRKRGGSLTQAIVCDRDTLRY